jgi:hypothetical protein
MSLMWTQCMGCLNPSECGPHGCARDRGVGSIVFGPVPSPGRPADYQSIDELSKLLNLPKAGKVIPTGWQCPACEAINAPHVNQCPCRKPT